jgi:hypothetical protein
MKRSCYDSKYSTYYLYGEKGIKVCDRWVNSFINFYEDMGPRPEGYKLALIYDSRDFSVDNCEWILNKGK